MRLTDVTKTLWISQELNRGIFVTNVKIQILISRIHTKLLIYLQDKQKSAKMHEQEMHICDSQMFFKTVVIVILCFFSRL